MKELTGSALRISASEYSMLSGNSPIGYGYGYHHFFANTSVKNVRLLSSEYEVLLKSPISKTWASKRPSTGDKILFTKDYIFWKLKNLMQMHLELSMTALKDCRNEINFKIRETAWALCERSCQNPMF